LYWKKTEQMQFDSLNQPIVRGRPQGVRSSKEDLRKAMAYLFERNIPSLEGWLNDIANGMPDHKIKPNPAKALELVLQVGEFCLPKMQRTEMVDGEGNALYPASIEVRFVKAGEEIKVIEG